MGRRGPMPTPSPVKKLLGNPGKRTFSDAEPIPPGGAVTIPEWLSAAAKRVWEQTAPICIGMGTLTVADVESFAGYCDVVARRREILAQLAKSPLIVLKDKDGKPRYAQASPYVAMERDLRQAELILAREFGLTPAGRSRLVVHQAAPLPTAETPAVDEAAGQQAKLVRVFGGGGPAAPRGISAAQAKKPGS